MTPRMLVALAALLAVLGIGLLADPQEAAAQMYRWTDDQGETHFTLGLDSVPVPYQRKAILIGEVAEPAGSRPVAPAARAEPGAPAGGARINFTPGQKIVVEARINGRGPVRLMLDTGADKTMINPAVLSAMGVSYRGARQGTMGGVGGSADFYYVRVDRIELGEARYGPLMVASHDGGFGLDHDGLLGRDFLDRFTVNIDNEAGIVTLTPKQNQ